MNGCERYFQLFPHGGAIPTATRNKRSQAFTPGQVDPVNALAAFALDALIRLRHGVTLAALRLTRRKP